MPATSKKAPVFKDSGETKKRLFSRSWSFFNKKGGDRDELHHVSYAAGKNVTQTNEKSKNTTFSTSATVSVGAQGEVFNASASITAAFQEEKAKLERQANESLIHAEQSYDVIAPKDKYRVHYVEWWEGLGTQFASIGFSADNPITYPMAFKVGHSQTIDGDTIHELFKNVEPDLVMSLYVALKEQFKIFNTAKGVKDYKELAEAKSQQEIQ